MDKKSYVLRNYHGLELKLPAFALKTKQGMKNNPTKFIPANIPVGDAALAILIKNDEEAYANWRAGGQPELLLFVAARELLLAALDENADYVDLIADGDADIIKLSGYSPSSITDFKSIVPVQIKTITISTGGTLLTGRMNVECEKINGATAYGCIVCEGGPLPEGYVLNLQGQLIAPIGSTLRVFNDVTLQRKKYFWNLTKGTDYYFYYYAINAMGVGSLSEYKMRMCN